MARRPFQTPEALVVVSTDGYFDVFPPVGRRPNARPAYRGVLSELGPTVRGPDGKLSVRPDSAVLAAAVTAWSSRHAAAAVSGSLGPGRNDSGPKPKTADAPNTAAAPEPAAAAERS
jgi:hypothetical protein